MILLIIMVIIVIKKAYIKHIHIHIHDDDNCPESPLTKNKQRKSREAPRDGGGS